MDAERRRYVIVMERGRRNWCAYVPDLPVCVSTGRTRTHMKRRMRDAMQFHIEGLQESGDLVPEPGSWTTAVEVHVLTQAGENRTQEYTVVLEPDDDRWSAAVPDVQGCIASGTTRDEAIANVRHALQCHLQSLQEQAAPIPAPGTWTAVVEVEVPAGGAAEVPRGLEAR